MDLSQTPAFLTQDHRSGADLDEKSYREYAVSGAPSLHCPLPHPLSLPSAPRREATSEIQLGDLGEHFNLPPAGSGGGAPAANVFLAYFEPGECIW